MRGQEESVWPGAEYRHVTASAHRALPSTKARTVAGANPGHSRSAGRMFWPVAGSQETAVQISCHARRFTSGQRLPCIVRRMSAKVLLLSSVWWPSVARLAAGFVYASCTVEALAPVDAAIVGSRYLSRWHRYSALFPH